MNNINKREYDLRQVLFSFKEALKSIEEVKVELPKSEKRLKEILEDSKDMVTLDEFQKKYCKTSRDVPHFTHNVSGFISEFIDCIYYFSDDI